MATISEIAATADKIVLLAASPSSFDDANTPVHESEDDVGVKLGEKVFASGEVIDEIAADGTATTREFIDGAIVSSGLATHWAILDSLYGEVLAYGELPTPSQVTADNVFVMNSMTLEDVSDLDFSGGYATTAMAAI